MRRRTVAQPSPGCSVTERFVGRHDAHGTCPASAAASAVLRRFSGGSWSTDESTSADDTELMHDCDDTDEPADDTLEASNASCCIGAILSLPSSGAIDASTSSSSASDSRGAFTPSLAASNASCCLDAISSLPSSGAIDASTSSSIASGSRGAPCIARGSGGSALEEAHRVFAEGWGDGQQPAYIATYMYKFMYSG